MDTSSFGYAVLATGVGMAIVFAFLVALSGLMVLLRRIFDQQEQVEPVGARGGTARGKGPPQTVSARRGGAGSSEGETATTRIPDWAVAAALAFVMEEERHQAPSAAAWTRGRPV